VYLILPANIGPEKVVFAIIFLLEYLNVVPRDVDYTRLHLSFIKNV